MADSSKEFLENEIEKITIQINCLLNSMVDEWFMLTGSDGSEFVQNIYENIQAVEDIDINSILKDSSTQAREASTKEDMLSFLYLHPIMYVITYAACAGQYAGKAKHEVNPELNIIFSWEQIAKARYWQGMIEGRRTSIITEESKKSYSGKIAAQARHKTNNDCKELALQIYKEGVFKSKNKAAQEIAKKVNRESTTVRKWLTGIQKTYLDMKSYTLRRRGYTLRRKGNIQKKKYVDNHHQRYLKRFQFLFNTGETMKENNQISLDDFEPQKVFAKQQQDKFTESQIAWLIRNRQSNGLQEAGAVVMVSRKFYINKPAFARWLLSQQA